MLSLSCMRASFKWWWMAFCAIRWSLGIDSVSLSFFASYLSKKARMLSWKNIYAFGEKQIGFF